MNFQNNFQSNQPANTSNNPTSGINITFGSSTNNPSNTFGNASNTFGNASNTFANANNSFANANNTFGNASNTFGNANNSFGNANNTFGNASNTFTNFFNTNNPSNTVSASSTEQELFTTLDRIEKSYDPTSSLYKFSHIFYNIMDKPFERPSNFPIQLWNQALLPDKTLMPVILNKEQVSERKWMQNDLITKLNESKNAIYRKIEDLKVKREMLRNKLNVVVRKYRKVAAQYLEGEPNDEVYKLGVVNINRSKYSAIKQPELLKCLNEMKEKLNKLNKNVDELKAIHDKKNISAYLL